MANSLLDSLVGNIYICNSCILLLCLIIFLNYKHLFSHRAGGGTGYFVLWVVFTLYSVFYCPFGGDNYAALNVYNSYFLGVKWEYLHLEEFHFKIMNLAPWGYFSWRFLLWGIMGATAFIFLCKSLKLDKHLATIACCTFALPVLFYYQRAVAGYSLIYISLVYFVLWRQNKKMILLIISIISLFSALPFHNAMIFYIVVAYFSLLYPLNGKTLLILILGAIFISFALLDSIAFFLEQTSSETAETAMLYVEENEVAGASNAFGILSKTLLKGPLYLMVFFCLSNYLKYPQKFTLLEKSFLLNVVLLFIFSSLLSSTSYAISAKFEKAAYLPLTLFLALYYKKYRRSKECNLFVYALLVSTIVFKVYAIIKGIP